MCFVTQTRVYKYFYIFTDANSQLPTVGPMHSGAMNPQRMMGTPMGGMPMRGVNQGGPRMAQPNMRNS
jgi:hypothetical protein